MKIQKSLTKVINWIEKNGWSSYDPNDIKGHPLFVFLLKKKDIFRRLLLFFLYSIYSIAPVTIRHIFKIKSTITADGMGWLALGYIKLYIATKDYQNLKKATNVLNWLENNHIDKYKNYCWGRPFDWQSTVLVPKYTFIGYTTAECIKPFIEYYKITKDKKYLDTAISACKCINENLNKKQCNNSTLLFSYTPLDNNEVININAIIASVFLEVGQLAKIEKFIDITDKIMQFVLKEQLTDGSWYYFSYNYKSGPSAIDNYHTAMILQSISKIISLEKNIKKREVYKKALIKGLEFYLNNFFTNTGMPKITPNKIYPINIASCAEAITLFSQVGISVTKDEIEIPIILFKNTQEINKKLISWTINNMQEQNGAFIERKYRFKKIKLYSMRWGQAYMFKALASAYLFFKLFNDKD